MIRNMRYHRNNFKQKRVFVREIYSQSQLTQFLISCEKKTHSDSNLNAHNYYIDDDEENKDFYIEIKGDEDNGNDFLNMQISLEKTNYTRTRGESVEEFKDDFLYGQQSDYLHHNFSEIPELQRRIGNLCHGNIEK